jgi:hypothetical protein
VTVPGGTVTVNEIARLSKIAAPLQDIYECATPELAATISPHQSRSRAARALQLEERRAAVAFRTWASLQTVAMAGLEGRCSSVPDEPSALSTLLAWDETSEPLSDGWLFCCITVADLQRRLLARYSGLGPLTCGGDAVQPDGRGQ